MDLLKGQLNSLVSGLPGFQETASSSTLDSKVNPNLVLLDVGGSLYSTTLATLTSNPDSMLGRMFSGKFPVRVCEEDNRVFIDRDGTHFHYILNYLRDPANFSLKIRDKAISDEIRAEAQYYGLEEAMFTVEVNPVPERLDWIPNNTIKIQSFSSQLSGFPCTNVLDPIQTYWLSESGQTTNQWMVFEFPQKVYINKIMMKVGSFECTAKDWMVQVSEEDDLVHWETVKQFQSQVGNTNQGEQNFDGFEVWTKYLKLFFANNWGPGGGSYILITDLKFFGAAIDE